MNRVANGGVWVGVLGLVLGLVAPASADSPPGPSKPNRAALLRAGADAARSKDWASCIQSYTAAEAFESTPEVRGRRGLCEEAAGRNVEAFHDLSAAMFAPGADPASEQNKRVGDALARVTTRVVVVYLASDPPDAAFVIDGRPYGKAEGRQLVMDPGDHTFAARLAGYDDKVELRPLVAGSSPSIHLRLVRKSSASPDALSASPPEEPRDSASKIGGSNGLVAALPLVKPRAAWYAPAWSPRGAFVTLTYASAAIAISSWAAAGAFEIDRRSLGEGLAPGACAPVVPSGSGGYIDNPSRPAQCAAIHDRATQRDTATDIAIGTSIGTVVLGVLSGLAIRAELGNASASLRPVVRSDGGGLVLGGVW